MSDKTEELWRIGMSENAVPYIYRYTGYGDEEIILTYLFGAKGLESAEKLITELNEQLNTIATLKAQRDKLLVAIKALRGDKPCGHRFSCICPDELADAAIAEVEGSQG